MGPWRNRIVTVSITRGPIIMQETNFFHGMTEAEIQRILKNSKNERFFTRGATIFREGDETDGIYLITEGLIKVYKMSTDGREKTLAILTPGDILGEMALFDYSLRSATAEALQVSSVIIIPRQDFEQLLEEMPVLAIRLIRVLAERLRQADEEIKNLLFLNARSRIILHLVQLAEQHIQGQKNGTPIPFRLTHAEMANLVGVSRETVTRAISELQDEGLIRIEKRTLWINDMGRLKEELM